MTNEVKKSKFGETGEDVDRTPQIYIYIYIYIYIQRERERERDR